MGKITINTKFDIGDKVQVIDWGLSYATHAHFAKEYGLKNFCSGRSVDNGDIGVIIAIGMTFMDIAYGVEREDGSQFIIGEHGIEQET